ncbi:MAG: deoxyhypusine synthase [Candidatus Hydrogenedentes bacterium]|nr:deoxyhypusine synthase [Candidatus Hydrogenedentota bacterium]
MKKHHWLAGKKIAPAPVTPGITARELIDNAFLAYNGGRLREACRLFSEKMLAEDVTIGLSISGALTPAGLGCSCLIPLLEYGFVDWIVSTGANLYHDTHFALGMDLHQGSPFVDDVKLREDEIIRIYDVLFHYSVLLDTDKFYRELIMTPPFQKTMGTAEFHYLAGKFLDARQQALAGGSASQSPSSLLIAAYRAGVPVYTSSPGDSSVGMNVAAVALQGSQCKYDPNIDVNETAAIVFDATRGGKSAILILGGGSPKNFVLQTEPHIQEILGLPDSGHTYFIQMTDARPDTGGLSGATPAEAVSWGKVDPTHLPDAVVCYADSTVALPLLTAYALDAHAPRPLRRLYERREELMAALRGSATTR